MKEEGEEPFDLLLHSFTVPFRIVYRVQVNDVRKRKEGKNMEKERAGKEK